jgi:hypothetical protein
MAWGVLKKLWRLLRFVAFALFALWVLAGIFHTHAMPPLVHTRAVCEGAALARFEGTTVEWRSEPLPEVESHPLDACDLADITFDAPTASVTAALESWRWQRFPCWPPPWEADPTAVGHERARATYMEAERRADHLEIIRTHEGPISDVAVPILEQFQREAVNDPRWDPEIIAIEIAHWRNDETIEEANARYAHEADLLGLPLDCPIDSPHLNNQLPGPTYGFRVSDVHGEAGLRDVLGYLCGVGAMRMAVVCQ